MNHHKTSSPTTPLSAGNTEGLTDTKLFGFALITGLLTGCLVNAYRYLIIISEKFLLWLHAATSRQPLFYLLAIVLGLALSLLVALIKQWEPLCGGSGIPQVEAETEGLLETNPGKILAAKMLGGFLSALAGLSVGREGPSIQMGAMAGKMLGLKTRQKEETGKLLLACGASAGLAAAFNAPLAGLLFSLEELHGKINRRLLVACLTASVSADFLSVILFQQKPVFAIPLLQTLPLTHYGWILLFSLLLTGLAWVYFQVMKGFMILRDCSPLPKIWQMLPYFLLPVVCLWLQPELLGGGSFLFAKLLSAPMGLAALVLLFSGKLLFSNFSFSSGVPGGIFFPILAMGAVAGAGFGLVADPLYLNSFLILGMAGYLTAIVRAPITAILLIYEMTGNLTYLLPLCLVCLLTYFFSNLLGFPPIYEDLKERLLAGQSQASTH